MDFLLVVKRGRVALVRIAAAPPRIRVSGKVAEWQQDALVGCCNRQRLIGVHSGRIVKCEVRALTLICIYKRRLNWCAVEFRLRLRATATAWRRTKLSCFTAFYGMNL